MPAESLEDICKRLRGSKEATYEFLFVDKSLLQGSCCGDHAVFLLDCCLPKLLSDSKSSASPISTKRVYELTHSLYRLLQVVRSTANVPSTLSLQMQEDILHYVFCYWNDVQNVVCHDCVETFKELIDIHWRCCNGGCATKQEVCPWMRNLAKTLLEHAVRNRSAFRCLIITLRERPHELAALLSEDYLTRYYNLLGNATFSSVISELIVFDLTELPRRSGREKFHMRQIKRCITSEDSLLRSAVNERLLPAMFNDRILSSWFLSGAGTLVEDTEALTGLALEGVLTLARFCLFNQKSLGNDRSWRDFIAVDIVRRAICHVDPKIRLGALDLICAHPKPSLPIPEADFCFYKTFFYFNMTEQSPAARQKMLSSFKKILLRMRDSAYIMVRSSGRKSLTPYVNFIHGVLENCFESLRSDANFNRRFMSLCLISHLQDFTSDGEKGKFLVLLQSYCPPSVTLSQMAKLDELMNSKERVAQLVHCLEDPYQICQEAALRILKKLEGAIEEEWLQNFLEETIVDLFSSKLSNDLAGPYRIRFYSHFNPSSTTGIFDRLFEEAKKRLEVVSSSLWTITEDHGALHLIMNVLFRMVKEIRWENHMAPVFPWSERLVGQLLPLCMKVAEVVTPVVHSMSPEGYAPDEVIEDIGGNAPEEDASDDAVEMDGDWKKQLGEAKQKAFKCQALLVNAWRTHKCVSNIIHGLVEKLPYPTMLTDDLIDRIGQYFMLQLTECKHCGAFETAVEGFEALCARLWVLEAEEPLPEKWLKQIIETLKGGEEMKNLCLTRRSAGLPFLVCAILGTEPKDRKSESLKMTLRTLLDLDSFDLEPKIHSLNVLRSIFQDNRIGEPVLAGVEWAFRICIEGAGSKEWPLRNAFAQLFAALLVRVFGVSRHPQRSLEVQQKCKLSAFEFFSRYSTLFDFLHQQLSKKFGAQSEFHVFPQLILLCHLFPSPPQTMGTQGAVKLSTFIPSVWKVLMTSVGEKTRELAVAALLSIADREDLLNILSTIDRLLLQERAQWKTIPSNQMNAILLLWNAVLQKHRNCKTIMPRLTKSLPAVWESFRRQIGESGLTWPDYNMNLLATLLSEVLPASTKEELCKFLMEYMKGREKSMPLTIRPLGVLLASLPDLWVLGALREEWQVEAYRSLVKSGEKPPKKIMARATRDSRTSTSVWVWRILDLWKGRVNKNELKKSLSSTVRPPLSPAAQASFMGLAASVMVSKPSVSSAPYLPDSLLESLIKWVRDSALSDDTDLLHKVIVVIINVVVRCTLPPETEKDLFGILRALLQAEVAKIREQAAKTLWSLEKDRPEQEIRTPFPVNPEITWSFVLQNHPELRNTILLIQGVEEGSESRGVFDASSRNPFAESFGASTSLDVVEELLKLPKLLKLPS
uniref:tRNA (32-2'-O)-methyltransferase regulator THADA n=1 Tax=Steinernema glaseri TaxID=37863 RepID=A0A1I7ZD22_9BILA